MTNNVNNSVVTTDDIEKIKNYIEEASNTLTKIGLLKDAFKDIIDAAVEELDSVNKKTLRKLIKIYHEQKIAQIKQESEEILNLYEAVFED